MNEKTQADYRRLAAYFYEKRLDGLPPTPKRLADALKAVAPEYRPDYWRKLRNAIQFDQAEKGFKDAADRVAATKNPVTKPGSGLTIKPKERRVRRITDADSQKLIEHFKEKGDAQAVAVIRVTELTGARPAELAGIIVIDDRHIYIHGAKKNEKGDRGADRVIELSPDQVREIAQHLPHLEQGPGAVQDRIYRAGKKIWPRRKATPTLYSYRHQMGADLKASGLSREDVAYIMGHQATDSAGRYGNPRTARGGGRSLPRPAAEADLSNIRVDHTDKPPAPSVAVERVEPLQPSRAGAGLTAMRSFKEAIEQAQAETKGRSSKWNRADGPSPG